MNKLEVIYEDNHIIVVNKKPNILTQADITGDVNMINIIKNYLKEKYNKPGNVYLGLLHRLDRPVGGVMVFAKTSKAASRLSKDIREHKFQKKYLAIINGTLKKKEGTLIDYLEKNKDGNTIVSDEKKGKYSELSYKVLKEANNKSIIEVIIKTGRHHQIRVQFASRGNSLCGDQRYGKQDNTQIALFAYSLSFYHPINKQLMNFKINPPNNGYWTEFTL